MANERIESKGTGELCGIGAVETLLSEGKFDEASKLLSAHIKAKGMNDETRIVKISLLFESKRLYEAVLFNNEVFGTIPLPDKEHPSRVASCIDEILHLTKQLPTTYNERVYKAFADYIERLFIAKDTDEKVLLTLLDKAKSALYKYLFPNLYPRRYSIFERLFLPKDKRFPKVAECILSNLQFRDEFFVEESITLATRYLEIGDFNQVKKRLAPALTHRKASQENKVKACFLLLCAKIGARNEEDFIKSKKFNDQLKEYKALVDASDKRPDLMTKYNILIRKNQQYRDALKNLVFTLNPDEKGWSVSSKKTLFSKNISIPEMYEGKPVVAIAEYAFFANKEIESIQLPDTIKQIGDNAFLGCIGLTSVVIPDGVTKIGDRAFSGCINLNSVTIPNSVARIGGYAFSDLPFSHYNKFGDGYYLGNEKNPYLALIRGASGFHFHIHHDTKIVLWSAFDHRADLVSVSIPGGITSISPGCFHDCAQMRSIEYQGTQEMWDSITNGQNWGRYKITYNYTGE